MFLFLCFLTLLYLPKIQPVSVRIDGMVELGQNWKFDWKAAAREGVPTSDPANRDVLRAGPSQPLNDTQQRPTPRSITLSSDSSQLIRSSETPTTSTIKKIKRKRRHKHTVETFTLPTFTIEMNPQTATVDKPSFHNIYEEDTHKGRVTYEMGAPASIKKHRHHYSKTSTRQQIMTFNAQNVIPVIGAQGYSNQPVNIVPLETKNIYDLLAKLSTNPTTTTTVAEFNNIARTKGYEQERPTIYNHKQPAKGGRHHNPLYDKPHYVKDDVNIQSFTLQIFKQNLDVFDTMKAKANNAGLKHKIDFIARSYRDKFAEFVNETQNQKIKTTLGKQKVVLNTIETSNNIIRRLLNFMIGDMEKTGMLRSDDDVSKLWKYNVDNEEQQEYISACLNFNICRSKRMFSGFVADFLTILLQVDDKKLKQGLDALTEVMKYADTGKFFDKKLSKRLKDNIEIIDRMEANMLRPMVWMMRNMLINKNKPLEVQVKDNQGFVNRSVAIMEVIDILDEKLPATEENISEWNGLKSSLVQWANGERTDILKIMTSFLQVILHEGVSKMNPKVARNFREKISIIFRRIEPLN